MKRKTTIDRKMVHDLIQSLVRSGWTDLQVRQALKENYLEQFRSVLMGFSKIVPRKFHHITVDYTKSLKSMLDDAGLAWISDKVMAAPWNIKGEGKQTFETTEFWFNWNISSKKACAEIESEDTKNPWQPAGIEHMLTYAAAYPEQQLKYPIIGLGSVVKVGTRSVVPRLYRGGTDPFLFMYANDWDGGWNAMCRFLAVRKVGKKG